MGLLQKNNRNSHNRSRSSSGTPKRHLSFQNMNSPPVSQASKLPTPGIISSSTDLSPFIKRKCISKEKPIKFTTFNYNKSIVIGGSDSPYMIASDNLNSERLKGDGSPKNLNDRYFLNRNMKCINEQKKL